MRASWDHFGLRPAAHGAGPCGDPHPHRVTLQVGAVSGRGPAISLQPRGGPSTDPTLTAGQLSPSGRCWPLHGEELAAPRPRCQAQMAEDHVFSMARPLPSPRPSLQMDGLPAPCCPQAPAHGGCLSTHLRTIDLGHSLPVMPVDTWVGRGAPFPGEEVRREAGRGGACPGEGILVHTTLGSFLSSALVFLSCIGET